MLDRDWQRFAQAADRLSKSKIFIDDSGDLTVMDVRARCRRLLAQEKKFDLIVDRLPSIDEGFARGLERRWLS